MPDKTAISKRKQHRPCPVSDQLPLGSIGFLDPLCLCVYSPNSHLMRRSWINIIAATTVAGISGAWAATTANGLVAIVNDEAITWKEVAQQAAMAVEARMASLAARSAKLEEEIKKAQQDALEMLVQRKLILHEFKQAGYNLPESLIEDRVRSRLRERWGGDRATMTRDLQSRGMTFEKYREMIREEIIWEAMRVKNVAREIVISPHKIEKYYAENLDKFKVADSVKLRTIMIAKPASGPPEQARRRALEILKKLDEGVPFAELAGVYSEDSFRNQGGDRGWVELEREHYQPALDQAIRALKPGEHSGVVETDRAFWIVLVEDSKTSHIRPLPEVRAEIERILTEQERNRLEKAWIDRLKSKAFIRYF